MRRDGSGRSRSARVWSTAAARHGIPFDEELVRNQDDEFNSRLVRRGGRVLLDPAIVAFYYARSSLRALSPSRPDARPDAAGLPSVATTGRGTTASARRSALRMTRQARSRAAEPVRRGGGSAMTVK